MAQTRPWSFSKVRSRIAVGLLAWLCILIVLGAYAVVLTFETGFELRAVKTFQEQVYRPTKNLVSALQAERLASMQMLGKSSRANRQELEGQRKASDRAEEAFHRAAKALPEDMAPLLASLVNRALTKLSTLDGLRAEVDSQAVDRIHVMTAFGDAITSLAPVFNATPARGEPGIGERQRALAGLQVVRESLAREISLLGGALAAGERTAGEEIDRAFDQQVGAQQFLFRQFATELGKAQRDAFNRMHASSEFDALRSLEDAVKQADESDTEIPFSAKTWSAAGTSALSAVDDLESTFVGDLLEVSDARADAVMLRAWLITIAGVIFVILLMGVWLIVAARHVLSQLGGLQRAAHSVATTRLPHVMDLLRRGEKVEVATVAPPLEFGPDEFGDVGRAINNVEQAAVQAAIDQAELRGSRDVLISLARRFQSLVQRQLSLLDEMERRAANPDDLEQLFAVDHLATRMRRHAEDLIIISGSTPGRRWRKPIPLVDVVRSAMGEVEGYARVTLLPVPEGALAGRVVADVIHLLAELIENAVAYSPPHTKVQVGGELVANGFVVEIEDRGLGMSESELARYNQMLLDPPEFNSLSDPTRLGLFVVARLSQKHEVRVHLRPSPYGGTSVIVLVPASVVEEPGSPQPALEAGSNGSRPRVAIEPAGVDSSRVTDADERLDHETSLHSEREDAVFEDTTHFEDTTEWSMSLLDGESWLSTPAKEGNHAADLPPIAPPPKVPELEESDQISDDDDRELAAEPGLPRRVRQASLADELRETTVTETTEPPATGRSPEQIRSMMTAFQRGSTRGRTDAERHSSASDVSRRPSPRPSTTAEDKD
ncbi:MAG: sensor histidine kinase [Micromonosporaceae bacterium]